MLQKAQKQYLYECVFIVLHPHSKLQKQHNFAVIDTFFVCSNEEDKNIWHFSIVMLQWWEKETTQKTHQKQQCSIENFFEIVLMKTIIKRRLLW